MTASASATAILAALSAVDGVKSAVTIDKAEKLSVFPACVLGLPVLDLTDTPFNSPFPYVAQFQIGVVVQASGYALDELESVVYPVMQALFNISGAIVTRCIPGVFNAGGAQLPSYNLTCEVTE